MGWQLPGTPAASSTPALASAHTSHPSQALVGSTQHTGSPCCSARNGMAAAWHSSSLQHPCLGVCSHLTPQPGTSRQHPAHRQPLLLRSQWDGSCLALQQPSSTPALASAHTSHPSQALAGCTQHTGSLQHPCLGVCSHLTPQPGTSRQHPAHRQPLLLRSQWDGSCLASAASSTPALASAHTSHPDQAPAGSTQHTGSLQHPCLGVCSHLTPQPGTSRQHPAHRQPLLLRSQWDGSCLALQQPPAPLPWRLLTPHTPARH